MLKTGKMEVFNENREVFKNPDSFILVDLSDNVHHFHTITINTNGIRKTIRENSI